MEKLLAYINRLSVDERMEFARRCGTSIGYLRKAISRGEKLNAVLCIDIDEATGGAVPCDELRPDLLARWDYLRSTHKKAA